MICVRNPNPPPNSSGPNVGAIAGGVIGGVAFVAVIVFIVWRYWIKKRREQQELEAEEWEEDDIAAAKQRQFNAMHTDAVSTRTRGSLANSILSRASNIIQIAYIPGVTNRNGSGHNSLLASPVPPIPAARGSMPRSPLSNTNDALFFRPGDIRDSSYSDTSSLGRRDTQYTRQSITPSLARSSMASTVYRDDATVEPMPATAVQRLAPRMVSVRSNSTGTGSLTDTSGSSTPVPSDHHDFATSASQGKGKGVQVLMPGQTGERPSTSSSLRSFGKAQQITLGGKGKGRFPVRNPSDASTAASTMSKHKPGITSPLAQVDDDSSDDEDEHARARQSLVNTSKEVVSPPAIQPAESPFFDASERPSAERQRTLNPYATMGSSIGTSLDDKPKRGGKGMGGLSAVIEEATRRASRVPSHDGLGGKRDVSPFSDVHATE